MSVVSAAPFKFNFFGQSALTAFCFFKRREKSFAGYILF